MLRTAPSLARSRAVRPPRCAAPRLRVLSTASPEAPPADAVTVLQTLRREVEVKEASLTVARLALREAERQLHARAAAPAGLGWDWDPVAPNADLNWGHTRKRLGQYNEADLGDPDRPPDLPPTPRSALILSLYNFRAELSALADWALAGFRDQPPEAGETGAAAAHRRALAALTLSNAKIWEREHGRAAVKAPWVIKGPYLVLCWALDTLFDGRPLPRLWFLESVARMPYFSYVAMLHLYESLGWWRMGAAVKRVHFAQEWNEFHHLLVMESLGGDRAWVDRFLAGHASVVYYWILVLMWLISPSLAYNFSELIEAHAVDTYAQFVDENEAVLRSLPPPAIAVQYWGTDTYLYDEMHTGEGRPKRRPSINTLYDVFATIRDDEAEHVNTMSGCQDPAVLLQSPSIEAAVAATALATTIASVLLRTVPAEIAPQLQALLEESVSTIEGL